MQTWLAERSLRVKLLAIVLLVEALMLAIVFWQGQRLVERQLTEEVSQRIDQINPLLNAAVAVPMVQRDYTALQDVAGQALIKDALDYLVVEDRNGRRVAATGLAAKQALPPADALPAFDKARLDIRRPITYAGEELGTVQYGVPLASLATARAQLAGEVLRSGLLGAALSLFLLVPLSFWLTRRLNRLEAAAESLAAGHLEQRIRLGGRDEFGRLGDTFDRMAEALASHIESLRLSEARFEYAVRGSSDGIWDWDLVRGDYYLSPRWKEMLGYDPDELPSDRQSFLDHLHPEDRPQVEAQIERHFRQRGPYDVEYRLRRRSGKYFWCRARGQAVWNDQGQVVRFSGATSDISDQKAAAADIQRLLAEKQALLDNVMVGIAHIRQDLVVSCNRRFESMFGCAPGEMISRTIESIYLSPTVYQEIGRAAYATLARGDTYSFELNLRRRDGDTFWGRLSARALDPTAPHEGSIWIFTDESERRQALDALIEERAFSDAVINSLPGIFYLLDQDGRMLRWNVNLERELGYRRRDLVRLPTLGFLAPEARPDTDRSMRIAIDTGKPTAGESTLITRDGQRIPYFLTANAVEVHGNRLVVGVGIDLSARKEAEEQVRRLNEELEQRVRERTAELTAANKELESFSYSVSHDLSSPLRGIDGFARIIEEDYAACLDAQGKAHLQRIRAATQRMQTIIDNMLSLSRITRNDLVMSPVNLSHMAAQIIEELRATEPDRRVEAVIGADIEVIGDANLLRLMLDNLLRNAWKFTARHPTARIELGVLRSDGEPVYFVGDDGAGFDMRYAGKLFREFQRIHRPSEFEGTGIGLAIASRVVQRHGGRMWAEAAIEQGATFYFTLPGRPKVEQT